MLALIDARARSRRRELLETATAVAIATHQPAKVQSTFGDRQQIVRPVSGPLALAHHARAHADAQRLEEVTP